MPDLHNALYAVELEFQTNRHPVLSGLTHDQMHEVVDNLAHKYSISHEERDDYLARKNQCSVFCNLGVNELGYVWVVIRPLTERS